MALRISENQICLEAERSPTGFWIFLSTYDVHEGHLQLLKHEVAIEFLHEFLGFPETILAYSEARCVAVKGTMATLAMLHAYVENVIICLRAYESEKVSGHRQKMYRDKF